MEKGCKHNIVDFECGETEGLTAGYCRRHVECHWRVVLDYVRQQLQTTQEKLTEAERRIEGLEEESIRRIQAEQVAWVQHNFGGRESWQPLLGAVEELGELSHHHLKAFQGIRMHEDHDAEKRDAVADVILFLCDYATREGFQVADILPEVWSQVKQRDWKKNPDDAHKPPNRSEVESDEGS